MLLPYVYFGYMSIVLAYLTDKNYRLSIDKFFKSLYTSDKPSNHIGIYNKPCEEEIHMAYENLNVKKEYIDLAASSFGEGLHCSQVTFGYAAKKLGFDEATAKKIGAAFGGGMFNGERCGALTGAMMGLSLAYGHYNKETKPNEAKLQEKRIALEKKFKEAFGSYQCADIIGANIGTPEGMERFKKENLAKDCPVLTGYVCQLLDELLD